MQINKDSKYYNTAWSLSTVGRFPFCFHHGCVGSGKSYSTIMGVGLWCQHMQTLGITGLNIVLAGKTQGTVKKNICNVLADMFDNNFKYDASRTDGKSKDGILFGQYLYFVGFNDKNAEQRIRGISEICGVLHDECTLCTEEQWLLLTARMRGDWSRFNIPDCYNIPWYIGTCNPDSPNHFIKRMIDEGGIYHSLKWLPKDAVWPGADDWYEQRRQLFKYNPLLYDRFINGNWVMADGIVYKSFDASRNVIDASDYKIEYGKWERLFIACDLGQNHPTGVVMVGHILRLL